MRHGFSSLALIIAFGFGSSARAQEAPGVGPVMAERAKALLGTLTPDQAKLVQFKFDDPVRKDWHWIPKPRKGLTLGAMNDVQKAAAMALLQTVMSQSGFEKAKIIMGLEEVLRIQEKDDSGRRDTGKYHWCIFGNPADTGRWGWGVEGHHFSVNVTIDDGKLVSATPLFMGANPRRMNAKMEKQPEEGYLTLKDEEDYAITLVDSLTSEQFQKAFVAKDTPKQIVTGPPTTLWTTDPVGLPARDMTTEQVETLKRLLTTYCERLIPEAGQPLLKEITDAGIEKVHFAWYGSKDRNQPHHYRIQGPTFVIDFDDSQADPIGNPANHIHSAWRSRTRDFGAGW